MKSSSFGANRSQPCAFPPAGGVPPAGYYAPPPGSYPMRQGPIYQQTGAYTMQTRQQTVPLMMQDPDEAFKVNMSPPPYEEIVRKTNR